MIKQYSYHKASKTLIHKNSIEAGDLAADRVIWVDLYNYDNNELAYVCETFNFHSLTLEDILEDEERAKIDFYDDYCFMSYLAIEYQPEHDEEVMNKMLYIFIGKNYLVTIHDLPIKALGKLAAASHTSNRYLHRGSDFLMYTMLDAVTDEYFDFFEIIEDKIEILEDKVIEEADQGDVIDELLYIKKNIIKLRKNVLSSRKIFNNLNILRSYFIHKSNLPYFADLADNLAAAMEQLDTFRLFANSVMDTHVQKTANSSNDVIKILTIISTIMMPLTFISGLIGMNVPIPYQDSEYFFYIVLAGCAMITGSLLLYFRHNDWI